MNRESHPVSKKLGITPQASETTENHEAQLLIAICQKKRFPANDPFLEMSWKLTKLIAEKNYLLTIRDHDEWYSFDRINYGLLPVFFQKIYPAEITAVLVTRVEEGPPEPKSKLPYKTIAYACWADDMWKYLTEKEAKYAHTYKPNTGQYMPVEPGILFSTLHELAPELFQKTS